MSTECHVVLRGPRADYAAPVQTVPAMRSGGSWSVEPGALADGTYTAQPVQADAAEGQDLPARRHGTTRVTITIPRRLARQILAGLKQRRRATLTLTGAASSADATAPSRALKIRVKR